MKNELYNLEGKTDAVSLNELFELRGKFTDFISPCRSSGKKGLSESLDASILGDGFHIGFEYEEKIYSLNCQYCGEVSTKTLENKKTFLDGKECA